MEPFRRNWLKEAHDILAGKTDTRIKKQHLEAMHKLNLQIAQQLSIVNQACKQVFTEAEKLRREKGLPPLSASPRELL